MHAFNNFHYKSYLYACLILLMLGLAGIWREIITYNSSFMGGPLLLRWMLVLFVVLFILGALVMPIMAFALLVDTARCCKHLHKKRILVQVASSLLGLGILVSLVADQLWFTIASDEIYTTGDKTHVLIMFAGIAGIEIALTALIIGLLNRTLTNDAA